LILPLLRWTRRSGATAIKLPGRTRRALQFPITAPGRIAVIDGAFAPDRNIREFALDDLPAVHQWAPEAIVAPLEVMLTLADQKLRGLADLADLRVVVVLTDLDGEPLADGYREFLWQALGVPVFEQIRGADGAVVARECEAHDGLHLDPAARPTSEMSVALVNDHCECGSEAPRLRNYIGAKIPRAEGTGNEAVAVGPRLT